MCGHFEAAVQLCTGPLLHGWGRTLSEEQAPLDDDPDSLFDFGEEDESDLLYDNILGIYDELGGDEFDGFNAYEFFNTMEEDDLADIAFLLQGRDNKALNLNTQGRVGKSIHICSLKRKNLRIGSVCQKIISIISLKIYVTLSPLITFDHLTVPVVTSQSVPRVFLPWD